MMHEQWRRRYRELERTIEHIFIALSKSADSSDDLATTQERARLRVVDDRGGLFLVCSASRDVENYYFGVIEEGSLTREQMSPVNALAMSGCESRIICRVYFADSEANEPYTIEWSAGEYG